MAELPVVSEGILFYHFEHKMWSTFGATLLKVEIVHSMTRFADVLRALFSREGTVHYGTLYANRYIDQVEISRRYNPDDIIRELTDDICRAAKAHYYYRQVREIWGLHPYPLAQKWGVEKGSCLDGKGE